VNASLWVAVAVAVIGALSGLGALFTVRGQLKKLTAEGRKTEADAAQVLSAAAVSLLEPAQKQIELLEIKLASANKRADGLGEQLQSAQSEIQGLRNQVGQMSKELAEQQEVNERLRQAREI
jgi:peptidoglycan hydrolase CwlO-like protein